MSINRKLLIVMLTVSLPPLLIISWFDRQAIMRTSSALSGIARAAMVDQAGRRLEQVVVDSGVILDRERRIAEQTVAAQVWELEDRLRAAAAAAAVASAPAKPAAPVKDKKPAGAGKGRVKVAAVEPAPPPRPPDPATLLARPLAFPQGLGGGVYAGRFALLPDATRIEVASGRVTHRRPAPKWWLEFYERAVAQDAPAWAMSTAQNKPALLTVTMPVRGPHGNAVAVTGLEIGAQRLTAAVRVPPDLAAATRVVFIERGPNDTGRPLRAAAGDEPPLPAMLLASALADGPGVRQVVLDGRPHLLAVGPSGGFGPLLVVTAPIDALLAGLPTDGAAARRPVKNQMMVAGTALSLLLLVGVILSFVGARSITGPILAVTDAAREIADGSLEARAVVDTGDEIEELAAVFNQMVPKLQDRVRMREALSLAMEVQQKLLPSHAPLLDGIDLAGISLYCDETGGDYYDFLEFSDLEQQRVGIAVGDVTGHGIAAALLMATARALLRSRAAQPGTLSQVMSEINAHIASDAHAGRFMTLFYGMIDAQKRTMRWVSAGHAPAMVYDPASDSFTELAAHDIPLGIEPNWAFREERREGWQAGEVIAIGTDGIWETRNPDGEMFGIDALRDVIRAHAHLSAADICNGVANALAHFRGERSQDDDVTLVVVKMLA